MNRKWWTLVAVCIGTFMLLLDITVVNVALPAIARDLHASFSDLQWVIDAYALALAAFLLTSGSLADLLGRRLVFVIGLGIFTAASLACGLASSSIVLHLARALQGIGGGAMFATSLALIAGAYEGRERGTAFGIWGATIGAAVAIGPLVGGVLTEGISWQAIFYVNLPIGVGATLITLRQVRESRGSGGRVDWLGLVTFSGALFCLVYALIRGNAEGWGSATIVGLLAAAALLLAVFVAVEARTSAPMLDLSLFRRRGFVGASVAAFWLSASMFAMFLYLTLYVQNILGFSALESGVRFLPVTLVSFLIAPLSGNFSQRLGVRPFLSVGLGFVGAGLLLMSTVAPGDDWTALLAGFLVAGGGIGMVNPALATAAVGVVEPARAGMASGINSTFRQVGIATGIAGLGALFQHRVEQRFAELAGPAAHRFSGGGRLADFVAFGGARATGNPVVARLGERAFVAGLTEILVVAGVAALVAAILTGVLVHDRDFVHTHGPAPAAG